jgi:hypothetical protein
MAGIEWSPSTLDERALGDADVWTNLWTARLQKMKLVQEQHVAKHNGAREESN